MKDYVLTEDSFRKLRRLMDDYESGRLFASPPMRSRALGPPIEVAVGKVDYDIAPGESGTVSVWRWDSDTDDWADTDDDVTAYDWLETGLAAADRVALLRVPYDQGVRWVAEISSKKYGVRRGQVVTSAITQGGSGSVEIQGGDDDGTNVTAYDWLLQTGEQYDVGTKVFIQWNNDLQHYDITQAECP